MSWKRPPARPAKQIEGSIGPRRAAQSTGLQSALGEDYQEAVMGRALQSHQSRPRDPIVTRGNRIKESARGKECQVRYVGICARDPACTIWSHARWGAQLGEGGKGMGTKADDLAGAYACTACDSAFDQMTNAGDMTRAELDLDWCLGHLRSLGILQRDGLI